MFIIYFLFLSIFIFISLFTLYSLVRNDFVLARKSLLLQEIFDTTFFSYLSFLFFGRVFFILSSWQFSYFSPLNFFHIIKYPGINLLGGLTGFYLIIFLFFSSKKIISRIFDIYSLSFYPLFIFFLLSSSHIGFSLYFNILIFLLSVIFLTVSTYSYKNYVLKDGSITLLFICMVCVYTIISEFSMTSGRIFYFFNFSQLASVLVFILSSAILLGREGVIKKN